MTSFLEVMSLFKTSSKRKEGRDEVAGIHPRLFAGRAYNTVCIIQAATTVTSTPVFTCQILNSKKKGGTAS